MPRTLTTTEASRMIQKAGSARDRGLVVLLWRAGMRSFEATALETGDIEELESGAMKLHIRHGKGDKPRFVGLDRKAGAMLRPLMGEGTLLRTSTGRELQTSNLRRTIPRLAKTAGVAWPVHPHTLRHTFARNLYDEGVGVVEIMRAMGHANLGTTQIYLQSLGCDVVVETLQEREW